MSNAMSYGMMHAVYRLNDVYLTLKPIDISSSASHARIYVPTFWVLFGYIHIQVGSPLHFHLDMSQEDFIKQDVRSIESEMENIMVRFRFRMKSLTGWIYRSIS